MVTALDNFISDGQPLLLVNHGPRPIVSGRLYLRTTDDRRISNAPSAPDADQCGRQHCRRRNRHNQTPFHKTGISHTMASFLSRVALLGVKIRTLGM